MCILFVVVVLQDFPPESMESRLSQAFESKSSLEEASRVMLERVLNEKSEALINVASLEVCALHF